MVECDRDVWTVSTNICFTYCWLAAKSVWMAPFCGESVSFHWELEASVNVRFLFIYFFTFVGRPSGLAAAGVPVFNSATVWTSQTGNMTRYTEVSNALKHRNMGIVKIAQCVKRNEWSDIEKVVRRLVHQYWWVESGDSAAVNWIWAEIFKGVAPLQNHSYSHVQPSKCLYTFPSPLLAGKNGGFFFSF